MRYGPAGLLADTTRWVVRFGYDGTAFFGWARQPGLRTVEGEILRGLVRQRIVSSAVGAQLEVASRTDRGVSARGNALSLAASLTGPKLLKALNGLSPELFFTSATPAPDGFRVRHAVRRVYRYYEPAAGWDLDRWRSSATLFARTVDVRSLGRGLSPHHPVWRTIESVTVEPSGTVFVVEVRAPSFVWGMVRKILGALREVDRGRVTPSRLAGALAGGERLPLPMAEPERLVLWDVEYPVSWSHAWTGPTRHQLRWWRTTHDALTARAMVLSALADDRGTHPGQTPSKD